MTPPANLPVRIYAHRGASAEAPENTLAAFRGALDAGAHAVELDVHLCASGEAVVIHDYNLARTAGLESEVERTPWSVIRELDAGRWKDARYRGQRVPLLGEVLDALGPELHFDVEIKWTPRGIGPLEKLVAREITTRGMEDRVLVSSFHPFSLRALRRAAPGIRTAVIYSGVAPMPLYLRRGQGRLLTGSRILKPHHGLVNERFMRRCRQRNLVVLPWTVDDPEEARRLARLGVAGIITNDPLAIRRALEA